MSDKPLAGAVRAARAFFTYGGTWLTTEAINEAARTFQDKSGLLELVEALEACPGANSHHPGCNSSTGEDSCDCGLIRVRAAINNVRKP